MTEQAQSVAKAFVSARRAAQALPVYPGQAPGDLAGAYRIQDAAIAFDGGAIAGWKVGRINAPLDAVLGANRLSGPIFADSVVAIAEGEIPDMPVFDGGFAAGEAELLLHVAAGWNGTIPADDAGTRAIIDDVRLGIEIASSPYPGINADGPLVTISDFGNNHGVVMGAQLPDWAALDLCAIKVRTEVDGETVGEATAATMLDGPYGAVRFLLGNLSARGYDLSQGLWVSTGAITGVHPVRQSQLVTVTFGDYGALSCSISVAKPR
ncbi:2-keto-4-pentenoate hydratase [Novosphingobium sp. TH158]|uniref:2-keto-4-pentenoate hydratase n=1 Tax=Novosphingobium sp. TH158 TaxID=2067455 RepID=UPI000C7AE5F4|nr:2-keto-4-pentenoate hydratase [Novosphingobium sp. TH158]PLK25738.1 2-keto-4-pentenoate hydratase [Novosphingobium sp. TH158]